MLSPAALLVLAANVFALSVSAHGFDWIKSTLDDCWQDCLSNTDDGCRSQECICGASQSDSYLPTAVECAVSQCEANAFQLDTTFLGPLDLFCSASGEAVPDSVLSSAYACATGAPAAAPSTRKIEHSTKAGDPTTTTGGNELESTVTSTLTQTTTDGDGNTIVLIVPIVMGPNTISMGKTITSTLDSEITATSASSPSAASPSQTAEASAPTPTQAQGVSSASPTAAPTQKSNSNGNGSPFENMQAGAAQWGFSKVVAGIGVLAGLFIRL